jgi:hypothetical protein
MYNSIFLLLYKSKCSFFANLIIIITKTKCFLSFFLSFHYLEGNFSLLKLAITIITIIIIVEVVVIHFPLLGMKWYFKLL